MNRSDNFTRADNPASLGTPSDGGTPWTALSTTWGIDTNQAYNPASGVGAIATLDSATSDVTVQATIATAGGSPGLSFRAVDASNFLNIVFFTGVWYLQQKLGGTNANTASVAGTVSNGDILTIILAGTSIIFKQNGTTLLTSTNANFTSATQHGLYDFNDTGSRWTAFSITDATPPPPTATRGLIPTDLTYWEYKAATGTSLSRLTFWMVPRNVLLYDAAADAALIYLQANTPAALQF